MDNPTELIVPERGLVSRRIFVEDEIFRKELDRIFTRAWLFVAHEDQIPNNGDYVVSKMGTDAVIVTRDMEGKVHVLLNTCTHRGMKLCRNDMGNARTFSCPYHGWSYSMDGRIVEQPGDLAGVPGFSTYYHGELEKKDWGLVRAPKVHVYKRTVWASWDPQVPTFEDYLGDMRLYLDYALDGRDGSEGNNEMIGGIYKWRVNTNWKFAPENFIGDNYHDISHRSVDLVGIGPSGGRGRRDDEPDAATTIGFPALGHGLIGEPPHYAEPEYRPGWTLDEEAAAYDRRNYDRRVEKFGDQRRVSMTVGTIFPNMSFHGRQPRTIAVFHPISPTQMEMWRIFLVDRDAPESVKEAARNYYMSYSGPGGLTESDDMENWSYATESSKGTVSRSIYFNYEMGLGHAVELEGIEGAVENGVFTEENARIFYNRWNEFMNAESWDDLVPVKKEDAE
ncbi:MAG TPA: aromatic ring-hydroxylating dioxygenase subunit alpha [Pseudolysinimonas sp.]|nr:aromatic ring-hydroxylating dioxygenase subunit alpha [Pseudolysinimonas sp.]